MSGAQKVVQIKSQFFTPVNHTKEFKKSIQKGVAFSQFLTTASNGQKCVRSKWQKTKIGIFGILELKTTTYVNARSGCSKLITSNMYEYQLKPYIVATWSQKS